MTNIVPSNVTSLAHRDFTDKDLQLIKRTVAADCNEDEFRLFISYCRSLQLDPRRKQVYALVYSKDDHKKRKMSIIVGIDGFRAIAARTGNYRPDDEEPRYEYDATLKSPTNPNGIVKATVKVWQHSHGQWFPVTASAFWSEYAPVKDEWAWDDASGKRKPTGKQILDGKWPQMGHLMIAKCAESLALRKAWPENFANVYSPEEMDQANVEVLDPVEAVQQADEQERLKRIGGGRTILVDWMEDSKPLEAVPIGTFVDRVMAFIEKHKEEPSTVALWSEKNRFGLREMWAHNPGDTLELKKAIDDIVNPQPEDK